MKELSLLDMELAVAGYFNFRQNIIVPNVSWGFFIHECDLLIIRPSGFTIEVEIKRSIADVKADAKKRHGHVDHQNRIQKLYFAVPNYLYEDCKDLIPVYAGILAIEYVDNQYSACKVKRQAVKKNCRKLSEKEMLAVARLGTMRIWTLKKIIKRGTKNV